MNKESFQDAVLRHLKIARVVPEIMMCKDLKITYDQALECSARLRVLKNFVSETNNTDEVEEVLYRIINAFMDIDKNGLK